MDKIATINGKDIELNEVDKSDAENFHRKRIAFCYVDNIIRFNVDRNDDRDHQHWITEDYNISRDEFESLIRGYISKDSIVVYRGTDFRCVLESDLEFLKLDLGKIVSNYKKFYNSSNNVLALYNGVKIGRVGYIWKPIDKICEVNINDY